MSKKNKLKTRSNSRINVIDKEKRAQEERAAKAVKVQSRLQQVQGTSKAGAGTAKKGCKSAKGKRSRRSLRIVKGAVIRGIKVTDAHSKQKIRKMLAKEMECRMETDSDGGWEEMAEQEAADMQMQS